MSPSTAEADWIEKVPWDRLSPRAQETKDRIATVVSEGHSNEEAAELLGLDKREVVQAMKELREEARALVEGAELPGLSESEREALRESLREYGQLVPVLVDEHGELLDGANRLALLGELGIEPDTKVVAIGDDDERRRDVKLAANMVRRSVSARTRRLAIEAELLHGPERSDRSIAATLGIANHTVAAVRKELEERGRLLRLDRRLGSDGVAQRVSGKLSEPISRGNARRSVTFVFDTFYGGRATFVDADELRLSLPEAYWLELGEPSAIRAELSIG